jgi:hypothetical protein
MPKLAFLAILAACGGGGGSAHSDADTPDSPPITDDSSVVDSTPGDAAPDAPPTFTGVAPLRMVVSGAKRLHGAGTLVVDVEIGVLGN